MKTTVLTIFIILLSVTGIWSYNFKVGDLCYNIIDIGTKTVEVTYEQESLENNYSYLSGVVTILEMGNILQKTHSPIVPLSHTNYHTGCRSSGNNNVSFL